MAGKRKYQASTGEKDRGPTKRTDVTGTVLASGRGAEAGSRTKIREALEVTLNGKGPKGMPEGVVAMEITPEIAADWLGVNRSNRRLRDPRVIKLAKDIELGRWDDLNGETLKFASDGELLDGQHRLAAVLVANIPIKSYVAFGVSKEAFKSIDTGLKRSSVDALFVTGEDNLRNLSATCNAMYRYLSDGSFMYRDAPTNHQLLDVLAASPGLRESAEVAKKLKKRLPGAVVGVTAVMHYLLKEKDADDCAYFFDKLKTGAGLDDESPIYYLRERLIHQLQTRGTISTTSYRTQQEQAVLYVKAWNAFRQEKTFNARSLRAYEDEKLPEIV